MPEVEEGVTFFSDVAPRRKVEALSPKWTCKCVGGDDFKGFRAHWAFEEKCDDCGAERP